MLWSKDTRVRYCNIDKIAIISDKIVLQIFMKIFSDFYKTYFETDLGFYLRRWQNLHYCSEKVRMAFHSALHKSVGDSISGCQYF